MSKFIWSWAVDGTIMYVYEVIPPTKLRKYHRLQIIKKFYTSDFTNVIDVAEDFIERLS